MARRPLPVLAQMKSDISDARVRPANDAGVRDGGDYILYWMTSYRRSNWNHSLDRAVEWAASLEKPLLVFEALRCGYPWVSERLHRFVLEGMLDNQRAFSKNRVAYYPYVEPHNGAGKGLLAELSSKACVVVADDYPAFFLPRMIAAAAGKLEVLMEQVDSNGLLSLAEQSKVYSAAYHFRHHVHRSLLDDPFDMPRQRPFSGRRLPALDALPASAKERWQPAKLGSRKDLDAILHSVSIDSDVSSTSKRGGSIAGKSALRHFVESALEDYAELRNHPEARATSGLSPYLHFGQVSTFEIVSAVLENRGWSPERMDAGAKGKREGFWGLDANAESFLDELVTWRELGFNAARHETGFDTYDSLPDWARTTLDAHRVDEREYVYSLQQFESAETHDPIWNAAQHQLLREGIIHGYMRMLWGKKILEWSESPEAAFEIMVELNNKYALDGRDPSSYSGILWVMGKYDRPWAPERNVFGRVRFMSSANTARKFDLQGYLDQYNNQSDG